MARRSSSTELGLVALTIEGGLIAPEQVQKVIASDRTAKIAESYACPKGTSLGDEIARYFRIGQALWSDYDKADAKTISRTAQFARDLMTECLGFTDLAGPVEHREGTRRYRLAIEAKDGRVPVVVAAPVDEGDAFAKSQPEFGDGEGGRARRSPTALLQDWLNGTEHALWGLVFAVDRVRIMRDNASLTRPAWIEADLGAMFRDEMFADFTAFWLLTHATRFGAIDSAPSDCALEQWREAGLKQGVEARKDLYANVATALEELGQGLVDANPDLREKIATGALPMQALFEELLRTVYRLIFLAVAEDRDLLHPRRTPREARQLYAAGYSFTFWRERSRRRVARDKHHDAWEAMKVTLASLEHGQEMLGLPALGGLFSQSSTRDVNAAKLPNRAFLAALFCLGFIRKDGVTHRINWRDLKTEELGSVYEGLLEIRPSLTPAGEFQLGTGAKGNDRKTSGSYYTPDSLVECLLDSALDPVLERAEANGTTPEEKVAAILDLKVIDPACGSGHFLLGAARRMADRVARLRNEDAGKEETQAALRDVVSRCIHGVDRNPMAVELAKVALWIESVSPGQPLGFLDANIRCGDALLGVFDLAVLEEGIPDEAYKPLTGDSKDAAKYYKAKNKTEKKGQGTFDFERGTGVMPPRKLAANLSTIKRMPEDTVGQVEKKREAFEAWRNDPARYATRVACDLYMAAFLLPKTEVPLNYQRGLVPTSEDVWKKLGGGQVYGPLEGAAVEAAGAASALHWPLAFPDIMVGRGGFDVVLGNPPWEQVEIDPAAFLSEVGVEADNLNKSEKDKIFQSMEIEQPEMYQAYLDYARPTWNLQNFIRGSGRYPTSKFGRLNTAPLFLELSISLNPKDFNGLIVPSGITTDSFNAVLFNRLMDEKRINRFIDFENREGIFPDVDSRFKFGMIILGSDHDSAEFASFITNVDQLADAERFFALDKLTIEKINPNTGTAPTFRSKADAEISRKVHLLIPPFVTEGNCPSNPWSVEFQLMFMMGSSSKDFVRSSKVGDVGATRFLPLFEGKMVSAFDHRASGYFERSEGRGYRVLPDATLADHQDPSFENESYYHIERAKVEARLRGKWRYDWLLGWKDVTSATNERTVIATALPMAGVGHTLPLMFPGTSANLASALLANLNSLPLDFIARMKVAGLHLTYGYLKQLPILPPSAYDEAALAFIAPRVLELTYTSHSMAPFARDLGYEGLPFAWDEDRRAQLRAELDAWYALAYGLTRDELRYVLDPKDVIGEDYPSETFRVLQKNEIARHGEYRTRRLVLAAYDQLMAQGMRPRVEGYR
ncbi:DNA methyltransferase [Qipengyuania sp. JC766]|uniref:Eco57I restriction-modification methylase domain-containing protein n=1 Tax=Qipengyuania sp. JC766 TaxID=3232139 RepID=UPI00345B08C4